MNLAEFEDKVRALTIRELIAAMRFLNGGPLGYDYMKTGPQGKFSKANLQERLVTQLAPKYAATLNNLSIDNVWRDIEIALSDDERVEDVASAGAGVIETRLMQNPDGIVLGLAKRNQGGGSGDSEAGGQGGGGGTSEQGKPLDSGEGKPGDGRCAGGEGDSNGNEGEGQGSGGGSEGNAQDGEGGSESKAGAEDGGKDSDGGDGDPQNSDKGKSGKTLAEQIAEEVRDQVNQALKDKGSSEMKMKDMGTLAKVVQNELSKLRSTEAEALAKAVQQEIDKRSNVYRIEVKNAENPEEDKVSEEAPRHVVFKEFIDAVNAGENVLLVGPSGCGKTRMFHDAAKVMGRESGFTGAVSSEHKLLGYTDAHGRLVRTVYRDSYEHGKWFLWDELDASSAQAMLSFNSGLANGYQDFPDAVVPRHKNFRAIASANTYGHGADRQYVGRNQMDAASLDRFYVIPMDYDEALEKALYGNCEWVRYVQKARKTVRELGLRHVVSMRAIESGLRMMKGGKTPRADIERGALWKHLAKDDVTRIKNTMFGKAA